MNSNSYQYSSINKEFEWPKFCVSVFVQDKM